VPPSTSGLSRPAAAATSSASWATALCPLQHDALGVDAEFVGMLVGPPQSRPGVVELRGPRCRVQQPVADGDRGASVFGERTASGVHRRTVAEPEGAAVRYQVGGEDVQSLPRVDEPQRPFGGLGASGFGRFGSKAALEEFTELRWVTIQSGGAALPDLTGVPAPVTEKQLWSGRPWGEIPPGGPTARRYPASLRGRSRCSPAP
jgi:hypothetical protein